jgi:hypothetical protein
MQPPTIALQRTRGAPRDRWHFERWWMPTACQISRARR